MLTFHFIVGIVKALAEVVLSLEGLTIRQKKFIGKNSSDYNEFIIRWSVQV